VGAAVARALTRSPWRVAVIASSSWSHSFLVAKNSLMFPDVESDKRYYEALREGDWATWRSTTIEEAEDRGHHELLNWFCLAGAMSELGRKPDESVFLESWISNSDKVFAVFRPSVRATRQRCHPASRVCGRSDSTSVCRVFRPASVCSPASSRSAVPPTRSSFLHGP
jgi:hypothetical protein